MALVLGEKEPPSEGEVSAPLGLLEAGGKSRYKAFVDPEHGKAPGFGDRGPRFYVSVCVSAAGGLQLLRAALALENTR